MFLGTHQLVFDTPGFIGDINAAHNQAQLNAYLDYLQGDYFSSAYTSTMGDLTFGMEWAGLIPANRTWQLGKFGGDVVPNSELRLNVPVSTTLPDGTVLNATASPARILSGDPNKVAIIGRSMDAVEGYAGALRANGIEPYLFSSSMESGMTVPTIARREFSILSDAYGGKIPDSVLPSTKMFQTNESWAQILKQENYTVIDLGNPFNNPNKSLFFDMEKSVIFGGSP